MNNNTEFFFNSSKIIDENTHDFRLIDKSGANTPILSSGMTPIKWDKNKLEWIVPNNYNDPFKQEWYNYSNKEWANAKTADGSFWVWVPRYAYKITEGYHTNSAGEISVKFLQDNTNISIDRTPINNVPLYQGSSQTNYVLHPAFNFGNQNISGFWVAKFEPSGTSADINIIPDKTTLKNMTIGEQFDAALNMKNNSKYGWYLSEVDTHMMKNNEWGAVAYLSKSEYGKFSEVSPTSIINEDFDPFYSNRLYSSKEAVKTTTTGNITGIYDMSGGAYERVAAYVKNEDSCLKIYGESILKAPLHYKDIYLIDSKDSPADNYNASICNFGDAVYETSSSYFGTNSWYDDCSYMPNTSSPWFLRGGLDDSTSSGLFNFNDDNGAAHSYYSFRPIVIILK